MSSVCTIDEIDVKRDTSRLPYRSPRSFAFRTMLLYWCLPVTRAFRAVVGTLAAYGFVFLTLSDLHCSPGSFSPTCYQVFRVNFICGGFWILIFPMLEWNLSCYHLEVTEISKHRNKHHKNSFPFILLIHSQVYWASTLKLTSPIETRTVQITTQRYPLRFPID